MLANPDASGRINPEGRDTEEIYSLPGTPRSYSPARQALHEEWLARVLGPIQPGTVKRAYFTGGGAGSGKSAVLDLFVQEFSGPLAKLDSDTFKEMIPEYLCMQETDKAQAARFVHEESSHLVKRAIASAVHRGLSFVLDSTFSNQAFLGSLLPKLKAAGYEVVIGFADCPPDIAWERAQDRADEIGRHVPEEEVYGTNERAIQGLNTLHMLADFVYVYSTVEPEHFLMLAFERDPAGVVYVEGELLTRLHRRGHQLGSSYSSGKSSGVVGIMGEKPAKGGQV